VEPTRLDGIELNSSLFVSEGIAEDPGGVRADRREGDVAE
jgi:hypothetical protein